MKNSWEKQWARRDAGLLLEVCCAVLNGKLGSGLGHLFEAQADPASNLAVAA